LRQAVRQMKSHMLGRLGTFKVREISTVVPCRPGNASLPIGVFAPANREIGVPRVAPRVVHERPRAGTIMSDRANHSTGRVQGTRGSNAFAPALLRELMRYINVHIVGCRQKYLCGFGPEGDAVEFRPADSRETYENTRRDQRKHSVESACRQLNISLSFTNWLAPNRRKYLTALASCGYLNFGKSLPGSGLSAGTGFR
jgi:hypothetical protein